MNFSVFLGLLCCFQLSAAYDVVWNSVPASDVHGNNSMPVGNGDVAANVWWDNSSIVVLLAKGDAWTARHDLLKIGRIRLTVDPPPKSFSAMAFRVQDATVEINATGFSARLWVEAKTNVLRVALQTESTSTLTVGLEVWRTEEREYDAGYGMFCPWSNFSKLGADVVSNSPMAQATGVVWYHRNRGSTHRSDIIHQGLGHLPEEIAPDPFLNRTFGGLVRGSGLSRLDPSTLGSAAPATFHDVEAWVLTEQTDTPDDWEHALVQLAGASSSSGSMHPSVEHRESWEAFWRRSWIHLGPRGPRSSDSIK